MKKAITAKLSMGEKIRKIIPYLGLIVVFLVFLVWSKGAILSSQNIMAIANQAFTVVIVGCGAIFVYSHGGLDFSLGALIGICSLVLTRLIKAGTPFFLAIMAVIALGALSGFISSFLSIYLRLPIFIITLSISYIWTGLTEYGCNGGLLYLPTDFTSTFNSWTVKLPVMILLLALSYYFFNYNRFGKYMRAIGGNPTVASLSGVKVKNWIFLAYIVTGVCAAIAALFSLARAGSCNATAGAGVQIDVMIGLVLGGVPLTGGERSKSSAIIIGALIMAMLNNGLVLCGVSQYLTEGITGLVFIIVVAISFKRANSKQILV